MKCFFAAPLMACFLVMSCNHKKDEALQQSPVEQETVAVVSAERGAYLVNSIGCADCHSPKMVTEHGVAPDPALNLSGHQAGEVLPAAFNQPLEGVILFNMHGTAQKGPWGVSFAANITPHETGIGNWTEDQFVVAMKKGKYKGLEGSRTLLPLMPWEYYKNLTEEDLKSIFAYLKTLKPIENVVPPPIPPAGA